MSRLADRDCPRCGSDFFLRYIDPLDTHWTGHYYCPDCDTLFKFIGGKLVAMTPTQEPYADFGTFLKGIRR